MDNENIDIVNKSNVEETAEGHQPAKYKSRSIVNNSAKMKKIYDLVEVVAPIDVSIHITGEDGCGKNMLAEYIHSQSGRTGEFVIINPIELNDVVGSLGFSKVYDYFKKHALEPTYPIDIFELVKPELARIYKLDEKKARRVWNYVNVEDLETDIKALYSEEEAEKEFEIARKWWQAYFYFRIYASCKLSD